MSWFFMFMHTFLNRNENRFEAQKRTQAIHRRSWLWSHFEFHTDLVQTIKIIPINDFPWYLGRWYHHTYQWRFLNHADYLGRKGVCQNKCGGYKDRNDKLKRKDDFGFKTLKS